MAHPLLLKSQSYLLPFCLAVAAMICSSDLAAAERPNILIITVDDMSADSIGAFGCQLKDTSPNIDAFAKTAMKFNRAHVQVGNCMPGRNLMWSGLFSHVNGVEGFQQNKTPNFPVLCDLAKSAGYFAAIRGKVSHSTPYHPYAWDADVTTRPDGGKYHTKDPESYGASTRDAIRLAAEANKPFCLMVNIADPHKPFYNRGKKGEKTPDPFVPTRVFSKEEVPVPGFLPSDDIIKEELADYYSTVRRADDCFGHVLRALSQSGHVDDTFIMFFSDHGMPLPFAKTQLYHHSTHTPLLVRWPGVTIGGSTDQQHMVSAIDFLPTLLDVMGHEHPDPQRLHGRSFAPLLSGQSQLDRDHVILQYNENSGRNRHPMRGIHTREFLYLFNPWSNGERKFATATTGTATYRQMVKRASDEPSIAARLELFDHRVLEELYDMRSDPDCLVNLIDSPKHQNQLKMLRQTLLFELSRMDDPVADVLEHRSDESVRIAFMNAEDAKKNKAKKNANKNAGNKNSANRGAANRKQLKNAIRLVGVPKSQDLTPGKTVQVVISHSLPETLGVQKLHVTLKRSLPTTTAKASRIERKVVEVSGEGKVAIEFMIPSDFLTTESEKTAIAIAAFVGEEYQKNLDFISSGPIPSVTN